MPVRRPSASAGHASSSASTNTGGLSRVHKSNDSHHAFGGSSGGLYSSTSAAAQGPPQHKVVVSVINRLKNKLPCNSGLSLDVIEADAAMQQTVECLVDLSRDSADLIAWNLADVVERLAKQAEVQGHATVEVLQSQLFILKVLAVCMASRWCNTEGARSSSRASKPSGRPGSVSNVPTSPAPTGNTRQGRNMSTDQLFSQIPFTEPPPLDDNCARYVLSVVILFLRQTAPPEVRLMSSANLQYDSSSSFYDLESIDMTASPDTWFEPAAEVVETKVAAIRNQTSISSMGSAGSSTLRNPSAIPLPPGSLAFERTLPTLCQSSMQLNTLIAKFAGRVVYLLSASNWPVVFTRIQAKIRYLAATPTEENPDIIDLHLMTHSALDRTRLVQILQELSSLLLNMKKEAQSAIAVPLRAAVWKWIETFPDEYGDSSRSSRRLEGAPERVFDALFERNDSDNRKVLWPALTSLLCISSERLKWDYPRLGTKNSHRKEIHFAEMLARGIATWSKTSEIALVCALDICRAAARVRPDETEIPVLSIASDLVHDIKSSILQGANQKPFWESGDEIDIGLFKDVLVTLFRFLPEDEGLELFSVCLEPERSDAVKTLAVKAALALTLESRDIPWHRSLERLEALVAPRLRAIVKSAASRQNEVDAMGFVKRASQRPKSRRYTSETLSDRELLVLAICSLWRANYRYYFIALVLIPTPDWLPVGIKVWESPMDSSVKQSTAWSIRYLCELIFSMQPEDEYFHEAVTWMKLACPATLTSISMCLLNARIDLKAQRMWMDLAYDLLVVYTRATDRVELRELQVDTTRVAAFALAEIAFLVSLTSVDMKVSSQAAQCLRLIAQAERQPDAPLNAGLSDEDWAKRHRTYDQVGDPKTVILGRVGHQKRIRKLVRSMARPIPSHIAVWQECYFRWTTMTELVTHSAEGEYGSLYGTTPVPDMTMNMEERHAQWHNLTLFLAAFGAACTAQEHDPTCLTGIVPSKSLPDSMRVLKEPSELMAMFITHLIDLLLAPSIQIRDTARDALGSELSSRLHSRLIKHLDEVIRDVTQNSNVEWDDSFAIFLDQFIAVLKLLIENVEAPGEELVGFDINSTLLALAGFIGRFHDPASYKIRIKFCALCDSIYGRSETLVIRRDTSASHDLLDIVIDWVLDPSQISEIDALRIQHELNASSLRTAVRLMDRLKLAVSDGTTAENPGHAASRLFKNYYDFLLKALEYTRHDGSKVDDGVSERSSTSQRSRAYHREVELRELVVQGLANLISSNTESSLKHCIPLAYHKDFRKRSIFARVFARVLGQGTKLDFDNNTTAAPRKSRLCELVKGSEVLAVAMCETCPSSDAEVLIPVLFNLFDTRISLMSLLKTLIDREIAQTENESSLFRSNNTTARVLSYFAKTHGYNYLRSLIVPLIKTMSSMPSGRSYELDPSKAGTHDVRQNQKNVEVVAASFLEIITASVPAFPSMFREICAYLAQSVQEVWPEAKFKALGSFIFLRFLSPAVVSPETVDVDLPKDNEIVIRRGLMVIAKIIQNLANNIFFGKEAHMEVLNDFLKANIVNVTRFLSEVNKYSATGTDDDPNEWLGVTYDDSDTVILHRFFEKHGDKVGKDLLSLQKPQAEADASAINGKRAWNTLCSALVDLGSPFEVPRLSPWISTEHRDYLDLMARYAVRSTEPVRDLFVDVPVPKNRPAIFVLSLSKIDVEALDVDLLMYHILKTLMLPEYQSQLFEIIIDCTAFTAASEVPIQWVKYCIELLPSDVRQHMTMVHILNPSQQAQKYFRRLWNIGAGMPSICEVKVHAWAADLLQEVPEQVLAALPFAASLEREECEEYRDVSMRHSQQQMRIPVVMHVGATHLRITSLKALAIAPTVSCKVTEVVSLAEVSDVYNISTGQDPNEFIIRRSRHGAILYFASPERDIMVKAIRNAKGQTRNVPIPGSERFSRLSNVSATLLHMGFYLVGYEDEELRYAACELLAALCSYLDYEGSPVVPSKAGFLPAHPPTFIVQLSERLAAHAPQLTLDFFAEVANGLEKLRDQKESIDDQRIALRVYCLKYLSPWIKNLSHLCNPTSPYYEHSATRLRDSIVLLVDMTIADHELDIDFQQYIWAEIGKLDTSVINPVLDELMRAAIDGGIGSPRCEIVANILSVLSSLPVRGKILSRLRKVITKTSSKAVHNLEENTFWNEAACLTRLVLVVGAPTKQAVHNQFYVPEIVHLVSLMAAGGQTLIRTSVYGIVVNLLQALYIACGEDAAACAQIRSLLDECTQTESLELFGLTRANSSSEYSTLEPSGEKVFLERYERLAQLLVRVVEAGATSKSLLNVWRARWMSLVVSTAFQYFPPIQSRSFVILGELATSDVDDDLLYQMLVAFKTGMSKPDGETTSIISMLRCISKVTPGLMENSRYLPQVFWLAVSLLQSGIMPIYADAADLLRRCLEKLHNQGTFKDKSVSDTLLEARAPLIEVVMQLDQMLQLSFESNFSFSMAATIFKGVRVSGLKQSAEAVLRSLLQVTVRVHEQLSGESPNAGHPLPFEALGYFLALIPFSTTPDSYKKLLTECNADSYWPADEVGAAGTDMDVPRIPFDFLGITESGTALLVTSFVVAMLATAQGDDAETEMFYALLSEIADNFPEIIQLTFESMMERLRDTFSHSTNPAILMAASNILKVAMQDPSRGPTLKGSASSLTTVDESSRGPAPKHLDALEDMGMRGLINTFQFLPGRNNGGKILTWIPEIVSRVIEFGDP
ncbi:hypothetical protein NEOLEDRAFT_1128208 [Neolentinus lepideus HHB14362 ss-1]|uniref:Ras-GAP domain-containing protein n=1 Tax=Neolentinus lepideus HHB14362 ss-1 TaxID=1314782 RepID=A0A165VBN3_9AGAM|nr:hypothetical protein NEOLEDRAFT_1128208 [Neolentinus lepideus HHB14362 ss-1]